MAVPRVDAGLLPHQEAILKALLEGSGAAFFVKDASGRYLFCNEEGAALVRKPVEEILGQDDSSLFGPAASRKIREDDQAILASGKPRSFDEDLEVRGQVVRFHTTKLPFLDADGKPAGIVGFTRDISARMQAEDALAMQNALLTAVTDGTTDTIFVKDRQGRYVAANATFVRLAGRPLAEILGKTDLELFPSELAARFMADDRRIMAGGQVVTYEEQVPSPGGRRMFHTTKGPRFDARGTPVGIFAIARDITERKQLEEDRARLLAREQAARVETERSARRLLGLLEIAEAALEPLELEDLLVRVLGRLKAVLSADTASVLLLDDAGEELVVKAALGLEEALRTRLRFPADRGIAGRIFRERGPLVVDDLSTVELASPILRNRGVRSLMGVPLRLEDRVIGVAHLGSLSPRHFTPEEVGFFQLAADRLAIAIDRVRLFEAERRARQSAQEAERAREELLAIVSHDLKSPLGAIALNAGLLRRALADSDPERARRHLASMERSARRMEHLIRDLLDAARIEAGQLVLVRGTADPASLLREAVEPLEPLAEQRGLLLELGLPGELPEVSCDREEVLRVITNLLENAIKLTPEGGRVVVRASREDGQVRFEIADTGPGIAPDHLPHLFDRYWQARRAARGGAGLGLYIARGIVEAHGGRLWAESVQGSGATFFFTLPEAAVPAAAEDRPGA